MSRKNPNGAGSYTTMKNGTIRYSIMDGYKPNGTPNRKHFYGRTRKEAKSKADQYLRDKAEGLQVDSKTKFSDFADFWYESHKKNISECYCSFSQLF